MNGLSLPKVSEVMSPKERAKLVISLELKGIGEADMSSDNPLSTEGEIKQIVAASPSSQIREYNFYISLHEHITRRLLIIIELCQDYLEILDGNIRVIRYLLLLSPLLYDTTEIIRRQPVTVKRADYDKALEKAREQKKNEVLEIDGRCGLAEQEAYEKLVGEAKIEASDDWVDGWDDYIDKYGKTRDQLIDEAVSSATEQLKEYRRRKELIGDEPFLWKNIAKYDNLSNEELRQLVAKNDSSDVIDISERIKLPTKEEYELWQKTVIDQKERILKAVKEGKLKVKDKGIEAGSYYAWPERYQKSGNELDEENIEMGIVDGEIIWSGDPKTMEGDSRWQHVALATPLYENIDTVMFGKEREAAVRYLESLIPIKVSREDGKTKLTSIELSNPKIGEALINFIEKITKTVNDIHNYIAVIERTEQKHFDGMETVSRDPKHPTGVIPRALATIEATIEAHNSQLKDVAKGFNLMGMGLTEYKFDQLDGFLLKSDYKVDNEWIEKKLAEIEEEAQR